MLQIKRFQSASNDFEVVGCGSVYSPFTIHRSETAVSTPICDELSGKENGRNTTPRKKRPPTKARGLSINFFTPSEALLLN
ncbi:MAG: hypothetical protein DWQ04_28735 [Chloroflexi bacterium]|nr:MAG: hypothetical protein DWQ04_28735 [Chloroflexota bacterium]